MVCVVAMPFVTMVLGSLKPQNELFSTSIKFFPSRWYPTHYERLFGETLYVRWYVNTLIVALSRTVLALFFCTLAGFAFAKYEFRFKKPLFIFVINDQKLFVLNLALPALRGPYGNEYGTVLAGATIATVPVVAVFVFMQRQFIEGIMAGALKS